MKPEVIIAGAGPVGLFAADEFARAGQSCLVIDSGHRIEERQCPESKACNCGICDILEGGGGAGGFSDGKMTLSLTRGTQGETIFHPDHEVLLDWIDSQLVRFGPEGVYYEPVSRVAKEFEGTSLMFDSYPLRHMGSDGAQQFIINFVADLEKRGVQFLWETKVDLLSIKDGHTDGLWAHSGSGPQERYYASECVVIATGLQGSPWFESHIAKLREIKWETGPAGFGVRIEARAEILEPLFSRFYDFKVEGDFKGLHLRSFCCNRQGWICNENHRDLGVKNVNGHSYLAKEMKTQSSNFALIAKIPTVMIPDPQFYVRKVARQVNEGAKGNTAVQLTRDFVQGSGWGKRHPSEYPFITNKQCEATSIHQYLPDVLRDAFREYLLELEKAIPGVVSNNACIYAPEIKYYGKKVPVDFETWKVDGFDNLHVIGNATGYLDSFVSCALTGVLVAQSVIEGRE